MPLDARQQVPPFDAQQLESIVKVLADTDSGLTGSEIRHLLANCRIPDPDPTLTKWKRLYNAFVTFQNEHHVGNHVVVFITRAMSPASFTDRPDVFRARKERLNKVLALCGMELGDDGKVRRAAKAETLDEAVARANRLQPGGTIASGREFGLIARRGVAVQSTSQARGVSKTDSASLGPSREPLIKLTSSGGRPARVASSRAGDAQSGRITRVGL